MDMGKINEIEERLDFIEFRQELLFNNSDTDRLLFEYKIKHGQYMKIMDLMNRYRNMIDKGLKVNNSKFESEVYEIIPEHDGNYHFCEYITRSFMKEGRWEEVFPALYGDLPKYKNLKD